MIAGREATLSFILQIMPNSQSPKESTGTIDLAKLIGLNHAAPETALEGMRSLRRGTLERSAALPLVGFAAPLIVGLCAVLAGLSLGNLRMQHARTKARLGAPVLVPLRSLASVASPQTLPITRDASLPPSHNAAITSPSHAIRPIHRAITPGAPIVKSGTDKCGYCRGDIQCIIRCSAKAKTK